MMQGDVSCLTGALAIGGCLVQGGPGRPGALQACCVWRAQYTGAQEAAHRHGAHIARLPGGLDLGREQLLLAECWTPSVSCLAAMALKKPEPHLQGLVPGTEQFAKLV